MEKGIEYVRELLGSNSEAALIDSGANLRYVSGVPCEDAGMLLVTPDHADLIIDFRYIEVAEKTAYKGVNVILQGEPMEQLGDLLSKYGIKTLFLEDSAPISRYNELRAKFPKIELVADSGLREKCEDARAVKTQDEIEKIKASQKITDEAFSKILEYIRPGVEELQIAAKLEYEMRKLGSEGPSFSTIALTGQDTSKPHGVPGHRKVARGDFVTMDFGSKFEGYCSDMTRTVAVGEISAEQRLVYDTVLRAHNESKKKARAGMTGTQLDGIARKIIDDAGYKGCFGHSLGHSLGLEIHERPMASPRYDGILQEGVVITIEPGIYIKKKFGVRIENMILLTKDGSIDLTESDTDLIEL
ncbi:MAG: aminopeptidase P family protein [Oscillospiraceae bacterium]